MHVYISVDMEGIAGIATLDQTIRGGGGYHRAQMLMTAETNAAIAGAFDAGATSVLVNDSHGTMDNLLHADLDPRARLIFGSPKMQCMAEGMTSDHDVALFVGYHAPAGGPGVLAHTFSSLFADVRLDGKSVSETDVNTLYAATQGVPVGLVTGDDIICGLVDAASPTTETVEVKKAHGWSATNSLPPSLACEQIRAGAERAVRKADTLKPVELRDEWTLEIVHPTTTGAELAEAVPGSRRISDRTISHTLGSV
ncbi:MAG: M55 family metallopeptidase, partial [Rhodococcus sp. (in: high G+C Gram-positive bacteria)]|nr:M55 family metallopeptidase [Rhodococcus sp. (in: high G+C Gram-positive bacteria)]